MATLSPAVKQSSVEGNKKCVFGRKRREIRFDFITLTHKGFTTVRLLSRRQIRFFRMPKDRSLTSSCKENSGLFLLKLFSALLE